MHSWEDTMRHWLIGLLLLSGSAVSAQEQPTAPSIAFDSVPNPLRLPVNMYLGEVSGVSLNSKGHIFVLSRGNTTGPAYAAAATQLLEFDAKGQFIREIGKNLYAWSFGHTVKVDPADNIWVTDKGSDMVIKFDPEGRVVMVFGRKQEASDEDTAPLKHPKPPLPAEDGRFRQVTDVAWDGAGNTFISDGYINSRVAKVDRNGNWLKSWGDRGKDPGQFNTPHSIATDAKGNVYVADRGNRRIQVFDGDGKFLKTFSIDVAVPAGAKPAIGKIPDEAMIAGGTMAPGAPWSICITPPPNQVLYSSDAWPGRIYKLNLDGKVLGVLGQSGKQLKQFGWIHAMACPSENVIYVAELLNWRIQKLILHP
jgi:DNA-binding beta-propeller fold protein YncE